MFKFFKRVRRRLLRQKKTGRYLSYALGEIVLVVIGILIALRINNWNEQRKRSDQELQILQECKVGLQADLKDIEFNTRIQTRSLNSLNLVLDVLESDLPYHDSLARHFHNFGATTRFVYSTGAFESMKSKGVDIISNPTLRSRIIRLYDGEYDYYLKAEQSMIDEVEYGTRSVMAGRFEEGYHIELGGEPYAGKMVPVDYESLKSDTTFLYYLKTMRNRTRIFVNHYCTNIKRHIESRIQAIEEEMEKEV